MQKQPMDWEKILANHMSDKWLNFSVIRNSYHSTTTNQNPFSDGNREWFRDGVSVMQEENVLELDCKTMCM